MPGFLGIIGTTIQGFSPEIRPKLITGKKAGDNWLVEQRTLDRFRLDKPFFENKDYLLLVEGVVLNRKALETKYGTASFNDAIIASYCKNGETFFNEFGGSFSGMFYDKKKETWLIYTDRIGDKQIFYLKQNDTVIFGSEMGWVVDFCKRNKIRLSLNEDAAYMLLTYSFLIENNTLACEILKLTAGHYLRIRNGALKEIQYHRFTNEPDYSKTEEEWIEGIDTHFRNAVKLQFDKDLEYGYKHITTLSGGLDSRMTVWVAHELGYKEMLNTTFSQSDYLDETIAKKIATDLRHDFLFKSLDHGKFLMNLDEITKITYGGANYASMAHGKSMYDLVDFEKYGLMHTGQIGDSIIGTFYSKPVSGTEYKSGDGAYNIELIGRLSNYKFRYHYPNQEIFLLYTRAFTGANQGLLEFQEKTESVSPFLDVDLIGFCYSIPVEYRFKHRIYIDWILKKYPLAATYPWEKIKARIKPVNTKKLNILGKKVPSDKILEWLTGVVRRRIPIKIKSNEKNLPASSDSMNPFDYWIENNPELREFMTRYFLENINKIYPGELQKDCTERFENGNITDKLCVLTLLSAHKIILTESD